MGQSDLGIAGSVPPNNPGIINPEKVRPETVEEARQGKKKVVPSRDYESAREDTDSSQDVQEIQKIPERDEAISKEAYIQQQLREVEQTLRQQISPDQGEKKKGQGGPEKRTITRAVTINERVESPKRGRTERSREKAHGISHNNLIPVPWAPPRLRRSPFSEDILSDLLPTNYKPINLEYDGKEDPSIHMSRFESMVSLHQYSEGIKCRIFSTTLVGVAQQWFQKIEENSIYNFEELYNLFMHQFASSRRATRSAMSLMDMRQEPAETLREYVARFNMVSLEIPEAETQLKTYAFIRGLKPGPFFDSAQINPPASYEDLLLRIPGYIQLEEARAVRRAEQEKNKPKKEKGEVPSDRFPPRGLPPRHNPRSELQLRSTPDQFHTQGQLPPTRIPGHQRDALAGSKNNGFEYTPLNRTVTTIFNVLKNEPFFKLPMSNNGIPIGETPGKVLCLYHNQYGHTTEQCRHLRDTIESLAQEGRIPGFVQRRAPNQENQRGGAYENRGRNQNIRQNPEPANNQAAPQRQAAELPPPPPYPNRQVYMIMGGEVDGLSNRARKQVVRSVRTGNFGVMKVDNESEENIEISFGPHDKRDLMFPHSDALVCTADIANCLVHRIFVDTGSAVNILYLECLKSMDLGVELKPASGPLYGFSGESVLPVGTLELPLTLGSPALRKTRVVEFVVMDLPNSGYNGILGRPALAAFKAIISMTYLKIKFPVCGGIGEVLGSQLSSKECYVQAIAHRSGEKRKPERENSERGKKWRKAGSIPQNRSEFLLLKETAEDPENPPMVVTGDRCMSIELFPGKEGFTTNIGADLAPALRKEVEACLRRNTDIFAFSTADLKGIDPRVAEHKLNEDPKIKPVKQRLRQFGAEKDQAIKEEVAKLLKAGHIREVKYPIWISNAVMVEKKDKSWRMCIDFRNLNEACPKDHYPLPRIDQLVDATSGCQLLSMMDAYQGYHQIKMCPEDVPKTAFAVSCGVYGYVSMPFGLKNAGATYQRMMDFVFRDQIGRNVAVYVDDMLVKSVEAASHVTDLEEVFGVLRRHRLMLNPAKCTFGVRSGRFLGYEVTPRGIEVNKEKVKAIVEMQAPRSIKEVQRLNGRITALSRFISRSADKSLPFFKILRAGAKFEWSEESQAAFENLKAYLTNLPILTKPRSGECLYLYLAVGEESLSTVLVREEKERQWPIYFISHVIQGSEVNYSGIEKAALAIMVTVRKLRPYFLSHKVIVRTTIPFQQTLGRPDLSGRMVKWAVELGEYDIEFEPRKAIKAQALADFIQETTRVAEALEWIASVDGSVTKEGCGVGVYLQSPLGDEIQYAIKFGFRVSNNEAEYEAAVRALQMLSKLGADRVKLRTDSQLVAQQLLGNYEIKEERMIKYVEKIKALLANFASFEIVQIPREENSRADLLARIASSVDSSWDGRITLSLEEEPEELPKASEVQAISEGGEDWRVPIIHFLKTGQRLQGSTLAKAPYGRFCLVNGQLFKRSFIHPLLKCIAGEEARYALKEIHEGCCGAHSGYKDLAKKIVRAGFFWPNLKENAREYVKRCQKCQRNAPRILVPGENLGIMASAYPFDKWGIDIVGKLPTAPGGKSFLIVAIDYFSKWVEAEAVAKIDEVTVERFIWRNICCRYGTPRILISDNGTQFTSERIRDFCDRMDIEQRFVSVAHPQANGQVEMTNRTICDGIQKRLEKSKGKWVEELDSVLWAHRTSPKTATGETPFSLVYGSEAVIPAEVRLESFRVEQYDEEENEGLRREDLDMVDLDREAALIRAAKYKSQVKANYDKRVCIRKLNKGDLVLKRADALKQIGKFEQTWEGPYLITEVLRGGAYHLSDMEGRPLTRPWNINNLKKFYV